MKVRLEFHVVGDGRWFLNFWNAIDGKDVIAEIKNGQLVSDDGEPIPLQTFFRKVYTNMRAHYA